MTYEGAIASYSPYTGNGSYFIDRMTFSSVEEWLIWLAMSYDITPDFEDWSFYDVNNYTTRIGKTIDLHTNEVVWDKTDSIVEMLKRFQSAKQLNAK